MVDNLDAYMFSKPTPCNLVPKCFSPTIFFDKGKLVSHVFNIVSQIQHMGNASFKVTHGAINSLSIKNIFAI